MKQQIEKGLMELRFCPKETALIVVDVQVDFCSPDGSSAKSRHSTLDMLALPDKINAYLRRVSKLGVFVVFTKAIVDEASAPDNLKLFRKIRGVHPPTQRGSGGEELCDLYVPEGAATVEKPHFDAFGYTTLKTVLIARGIHNVLVCGVRTEICVEATARRAAVEGFHTVILSDLVATRDANRVDAARAMEFFGNYYGFVFHSNEVPFEERELPIHA